MTTSPLFTPRNTGPAVMPAAAAQLSIAAFVHAGMGTVRTRPFLPTRSTTHQRPSRCWICSKVSRTASSRRSPQPTSTARMARSRLPWLVAGSGAASSVSAWRLVSQLPVRTPLLLGAADVPDGLRRGRIEQPVVRCFRRQLPHRREFLVHAGRREAFRFERRPPGLHRGAGERRPALAVPPDEEILERPGVHDAGERARDGVQDQLLDGGERIRAAVGERKRRWLDRRERRRAIDGGVHGASSTSAASAAAAALRRSPSRVASGSSSRIAMFELAAS